MPPYSDHKRIVSHTAVQNQLRTIHKTYKIEYQPRFPYPVYARLWIPECRGPRLVHNRNNASIKDNTNQDNYLNPKTNNYADNLALLREMGVSTVLKDYGTDILDAIRGNDLHRLQLILEKQLKGDSKIARVCVTDIKHRPSKKFACPLILAARQEDPAILQWMMSKRVDPNFVHHTIYSSKRREVVTALHIAVDLGYYDSVEVLLNANADCNLPDHKEETPLHIAVKKADRVMCQMLLSRGADPTIVDATGNAALHVATLFGHLQLVRVLLKYDADIFQKGADGAIPPHIAAKEGHIHLMHLFCARHLGNVNIKIPCYSDRREKAPLHMAAENGHKEITHVLIDQYDADVNVRDSDANTALHCCVLNPYDPHRMREKEDFYDTAKVLLRARVAVNAKNAFGDTALHLAAMNRFQRIVELLLEVGANPFVENDEKLKPIDVVPDDDPVTKQVLKTAMLQGPRPMNLSVETLNRDISGSFMNFGGAKPMHHNKSNARSTATIETRSSDQSGSYTDSQNSQDRSSERDPGALDRSLSIGTQRDSRVSLPSVFGGGQGGESGGHGHGNDTRQRAPTNASEQRPETTASGAATGGKPKPLGGDRDKSSKDNKNQNLEKTRAVDGAVRGEGQGQEKGQKGSRGQAGDDVRQRGRHGERIIKDGGGGGGKINRKPEVPSEYTEMGNVPMRKKQGRDPRRDRDQDTTFEEQDTYSFLSSRDSLSTLRDGSTQTLDDSNASRSRGVQATSRQKKRSVSKQAQTSFVDDMESVTTMTDTLSRASDLYSDTSEFTEYSQEPVMRRGGSRDQGQTGNASTRDRKRLESEDYDDEKVIYENLDDTLQSMTSTASSRPVRNTSKQYRIERSRQKYNRKSSSRISTTSDMSTDMEQSQVAPYTPQNAATSAFDPSAPVPGSVKVNSVPGRPGTIELQYSGGPITIALDTQAFSAMPADDQGEFFYDGAGNKYPVSLITALQRASLLNKTPIVTSQKGTQAGVEDGDRVIRATSPSKVDKATGLDQETIYVNQDDITAMLNSSLATTVQDTSADMTTQTFNTSQPEQVTSAITQTIHEHTKTRSPYRQPPPPPRDAALSPLSHTSSLATNEDRATPTRGQQRKKGQKDQLSKILGKAKGMRRGGTPTMGGQGGVGQEPEGEELKGDTTVEDQPTVSTQDEDSDQSEATQSDEDDVTPAHALGPPPPLPDTSPPKHRLPPQKKERKKSKQKHVDDETFEHTPVLTRELAEQQMDESMSPDIWDKSPNTPPFKTFGEKMAWAKALEQGQTPELAAKSKSRDKKPRPPLGSQSEKPKGTRKKRHSVIEEETEEESEEEEESSEEETGSETDSEAEEEVSDQDKTKVQKMREIPTIRMESMEVIAIDHNEKQVERTESLEILEHSQFDRDGEIENEIEQYAVEHNIRTLDRVISPRGGRGSGAATPDSVYSEGGSLLNLRVSGPTPKAYSRTEKDAARIAWLKAKPERFESASDMSDSEYGSRHSLNRSTNSLDRSLSPASGPSRRWSEEGKPLYRKQTPTGSRYSKRPTSDPSVFEDAAGDAAGAPKPKPRGKKVKMIGSYAKPYKPLGDFDVQTDLLEDAMSPFSPLSPIHMTIEEEETAVDVRESKMGTQHYLSTASETVTVIETVTGSEIHESRPLQARTSRNADEIKFMDSTEELDVSNPESEQADTSISGRSFKKNIKIYEQAPEEYETLQYEQDVAMDPALVAKANEARLKRREMRGDLKFMDSTEELDVDEAESEMANESISGKSFKRNIKIFEEAPEEYVTEMAKQEVAIDPELVALADEEKKRKKKEKRSKKKKKTVVVKETDVMEQGVVETLTTTVERTELMKPVLAVAEVVNTDESLLDDRTVDTEGSSDDSSADSGSDMEEYDQEPGRRRSPKKQKKQYSYTVNEDQDDDDSEGEDEESYDEDDDLAEYDEEPRGRKKPRSKSKSKVDDLPKVHEPGEAAKIIADTEKVDDSSADDLEHYEREPGSVRPTRKAPSPPKGTSTPNDELEDAMEQYDQEPGVRRRPRPSKPPPPPPQSASTPNDQLGDEEQPIDPAELEKYKHMIGGQPSPKAIIAEAKARGKLRRSVDEYIAEGHGQGQMSMEDEEALARAKDVEIVDVFMEPMATRGQQPLQAHIEDTQGLEEGVVQKTAKKSSKDKTKKKKKKRVKSGKEGDVDMSMDTIELDKTADSITVVAIEPTQGAPAVAGENEPIKKKKKKTKDGTEKPKKKKKFKDKGSTEMLGPGDEQQGHGDLDFEQYGSEPGGARRAKPIQTKAEQVGPDPRLVAQVLMNQGGGVFMDEAASSQDSDSNMEEYDREPGARRAKPKKPKVHFPEQMEIELPLEETGDIHEYDQEPGGQKRRHKSSDGETPRTHDASLGFETLDRSFDSELDEEVAHINKTADERRKRTKEKKKKQDKATKKWAEEQKAADERRRRQKEAEQAAGKQQPNAEPANQEEGEPEVINNEKPQLPPGFSHTPPDKAAVEITFEGIQVIDQTQQQQPKKKKKKTKGGDESKDDIDPNKVKKKKKKKDKEGGDEATTKKKKKKKTKEDSVASSEASTQPTVISEPLSELSMLPPSGQQPMEINQMQSEDDDLEEYAAEPGRRRRPKVKFEPKAKSESIDDEPLPPPPPEVRPKSGSIASDEPLPPPPLSTSSQDPRVPKEEEEPLPSALLTADALAAKALEDVKAHRQYHSSGSDESSVATGTAISVPVSDPQSTQVSGTTTATSSDTRPSLREKSMSMSSATSGEELEGISTTVMGAKVQRDDTVRRKGDALEGQPKVTRRREVSEELSSEEESEYSEYSDDEYSDEEEEVVPAHAQQGQVHMTSSRVPKSKRKPMTSSQAPPVTSQAHPGAPISMDEEPIPSKRGGGGKGGPSNEDKMWQQYQKQKSHDSQEHPMDMGETNIDESIEETNIDDEESGTGSEYTDDSEAEEEAMEQQNGGAPGAPRAGDAFKREQGVRQSQRVARRNQRRKKQDEDVERHPDEKPRPAQGTALPIDDGSQHWRDQNEQQQKMKEILQAYDDFGGGDMDPSQQQQYGGPMDPRDPRGHQGHPGRGQGHPGMPQGHPHPGSQQGHPGVRPRGSSGDPRTFVPRPGPMPGHQQGPQDRHSQQGPQDMMGQMWAQQHPPQHHPHPNQRHHERGGRHPGDENMPPHLKRHPTDIHDPYNQRGGPKRVRLPQSVGAISDTEMMPQHSSRRRQKHARFAQSDLHSEGEMFDLEPPKARDPGKSLQEAALESLKDSLQNQPKVSPRRPIESMPSRTQADPVNYTRGVYRPQPVHWRGSRGNTLPGSGRYDDSQLAADMWLDRHGDRSVTEDSEGEVDDEIIPAHVDPRIHAAQHHPHGQYPPGYDPRRGPLPPVPHDQRSRSLPPGGHMPQYGPGGDPGFMPHGGDPRWHDMSHGSLPGGQHPGGAFQPVGPGQQKRVKIFERQKRREARAARGGEPGDPRPDRPIKTEPGPVDFSKYPPTAKLWMEKVDSKTVQKSKTMYLSVMPEGLKPPPELEKDLPKYENTADDVFLPPQWVIARGRSLRKRKQKLDRAVARESTGNLSGITSGESDVEGMDRPLSPGKQMLLFFRVGSNWKDLSWVIMDGIQSDAETLRMNKDIELKHPGSLTEQVHDMMHRWWKKKGPSATIEELRHALDFCNIPYIEEEYFNQLQKEGRLKSITSFHESEGELDASEISDVDPDVSRLIQEYEVRSPNQSFDVLSGGGPGTSGAPRVVSVDNLLRRMEDKGVKIDRSRVESNLSAASRDSVFQRGRRERYESGGDSFDEYLSDGDVSRRSFLIVQPQLKQEDYNYETQI